MVARLTTKTTTEMDLGRTIGVGGGRGRTGKDDDAKDADVVFVVSLATMHPPPPNEKDGRTDDPPR